LLKGNGNGKHMQLTITKKIAKATSCNNTGNQKDQSETMSKQGEKINNLSIQAAQR
jgi:predicted ATPase